MKSFAVLALFVFLHSLPALADQTSCEASKKTLLADDLLKKLTVKVCPPENTSDPDVSMEYDRAYESSTASEFLVYQYTDKCFEKINRELFKKTEEQNPDILQLAQQLDAVLCDYAISEKEVFRGANLPEQIVEKYHASEEISFPAFSSTSMAFNVGCEFAKKGNTLFKIISKSGRVVENQSKHDQEAEVLFRMNARFKVKVAVSGFKASTMTGCKGISNYFELEEIYTDELKPFVWPY